MSNTAEIRLLNVFASTAPISGVNAANEEANSNNNVFASNQLNTAGATRRIFAHVSRILLRMEAKTPILSWTSITGASANRMAMMIPGTTTSMMPICTINVVRRISKNNFGNTGALAPIARNALTCGH